MALELTVKDSETGDEVTLEVEPDTTINEIIETVGNFWNKPAGAYVLRHGSRLLRGQDTITFYGLQNGDVLEMIPDPEGGY